MLASFLVRLRALVNRRRMDAELREELEYHLEREAERHVAAGMDPREAREAARRALGNLTVATENARDAWRWRLLEEMRQDVSYGLRTFRRAPLFVVTVVATIGVGLGLLSAAFTTFDTYVLRPIAVRDPAALYEPVWHARNGAPHQFTWAQYLTLRSRTDLFTEVFAFSNQYGRVHGVPASGQLVSGNYFDVLGVPPALGRVLVPADAAAPAANAVVVLSYRFWQGTFAGDSAVLGTKVQIAGVPLTVVGVAQDGFGGLAQSPFDYWVPLGTPGVSGDTLAGGADGVRVVGRVRPENGVDRTAAMLVAWMRVETAALPPRERATDVGMIPRGTMMPRSAEAIEVFAPVILAFALVLLIACANVANMMLARGMARQREIGIRLALGAGRARIVRQLLVEALMLSLPAGLTGYLISRAAIGASVGTMMATVPAGYRAYLHVAPFEVTTRVVAFVILSAVAVSVLFGLVPALQTTRPNIVKASRGDFDAAQRPSRLRNGLVVAQICGSVVLLVCAGILLSSARDSATADPGYAVSNLLGMKVLDSRRDRVLVALRAQPNVVRIASAAFGPLDGVFSSVPLTASHGAAIPASFNVVSSDYLAALGLPIVAGRNFTAEEARERAPVVIVSRAAAQRFWPDRNPIGETLTAPPADAYPRLAGYRTAHVIGVSTDAVPGLILKGRVSPVVFYPQPDTAAGSQLVVRLAGDADAGRAGVDRAIATTVDSAAIIDMHTFAGLQAMQVYPLRAAYWIASAVGVLALALTLTGIYGTLSYLVSQRRKEFGIRMALGSPATDVAGLVLRQALRLSLAGIGVGLVVALAFSRVIGSVIKVIDVFNARGYAGGAAMVLGTCLIASYLPARRAALANPVEALRADS